MVEVSVAGSPFSTGNGKLETGNCFGASEMGTELVLGKETKKMWGRTILTKMKLIYHGMHTLFPRHYIYRYNDLYIYIYR